MIDAYWYAGARTAHEGQSVYSRRGGGTRIGERIAGPGVHLFSDPAYAGLECTPFVIGGDLGQRAVGLRQRPAAGAHRLDPRRRVSRR